MSKLNTVTVSETQAAASVAIVGAALKLEVGAAHATLQAVISEGRKLTGMTSVHWDASPLPAAFKAMLEANGSNERNAANRLTLIKSAILISANRPKGLKPGKWEGDAKPGENLQDFKDRLVAFRDALQTASGDFVMFRKADGSKATRGAAKGTKSKGGRKATRTAPAAAPKPLDATEAAFIAARQLMQSDEGAKRLIRIVSEARDAFDVWSRQHLATLDEAAKVAAAREAANVKAVEAAAKAAQSSNLAAPSVAQAKAKANGSKPNGAAAH